MSKRSPEQEARRTALLTLFCLMEQELSGYSLRQQLESWGIAEYLPVSPATIYRSLDRLEKQGLLTSREEKLSKYPSAKLYQITSAGKQAYRDMMLEQGRFFRSQYSCNMMVGLNAYLSAEQKIELARNWQTDARNFLRTLELRFKTYSKRPGKPYAEWLLLDHEMHMLKAEIRWMSKFIALVEGKQA
jgi:DNA-binding PadR family transcriptional regulator